MGPNFWESCILDPLERFAFGAPSLTALEISNRSQMPLKRVQGRFFMIFSPHLRVILFHVRDLLFFSIVKPPHTEHHRFQPRGTTLAQQLITFTIIDYLLPTAHAGLLLLARLPVKLDNGVASLIRIVYTTLYDPKVCPGGAGSLPWTGAGSVSTFTSPPLSSRFLCCSPSMQRFWPYGPPMHSIPRCLALITSIK